MANEIDNWVSIRGTIDRILPDLEKDISHGDIHIIELEDTYTILHYRTKGSPNAKFLKDLSAKYCAVIEDRFGDYIYGTLNGMDRVLLFVNGEIILTSEKQIDFVGELMEAKIK
jgi:hypothetical protein